MSNYKSLQELTALAALVDSHKVMVVLNPLPGDTPPDDSVGAVDLTALRTFLLSQTDSRLSALEARPAGGTFTTPVTLALTGAVTGSAAFDGSADFSLITDMGPNAIGISSVSNLATSLQDLQDQLDTAATTYALSVTVFSAGNGLAGGGTLAGSRAFTLGVPSTLGGGTTNAVTATSHTHALALTVSDIPDLPGSKLTTGSISLVDGTFSGTVNAASYGGAGVSQSPSNSTLVQRTSAGYINCNYINTTANDIGAGAPSHLAVQTASDGYHRWQTPANFIAVNGILKSGAVASFSRAYAGYDSGTANSFSCSGWFRAGGQTGLYCADYGGGIYMTDTTYVRTYSGKAMAASDFVISSDRRLKTGIRDLDYKGRLRPVLYTLSETGKNELGFIAQEVEEHYPEAVGIIPATGMLQLSYGRLTAVISAQVNLLEDDHALTKTLTHTHTDQIATLTAEVAALRDLVASLKSAVHD